MPEPTVLRWGIISTGWIATVFVKDLLVDPKSRDVHDVIHKVVAVGSRTVEKAQEFIDTVAGGDKAIKAHGSYEEVYANQDVDAIYVGTPHTLHYTNALDAIKAEKHVLVEKPVTVNSAELRSLIAAAKENNVFFMEALWTRFLPISLAVKKILDEGSLGLPVVVQADLSHQFELHKLPDSHRILNPQLGGGALLDLGPYPLVWAIMTLFEHPANKSSKPSNISATMLKNSRTKVDQNTSFTVTFDNDGLSAQAILSCSINLHSSSPGAVIRCEKGNIKIAPSIPVPPSFTVEYLGGKKGGDIIREEKHVFTFEGGGWHFQADEVARCVRDGKLESALWGHDKSLLEMEIFDEVRKQGGYTLPPGVEKVQS